MSVEFWDLAMDSQRVINTHLLGCDVIDPEETANPSPPSWYVIKWRPKNYPKIDEIGYQTMLFCGQSKMTMGKLKMSPLLLSVNHL